LARERDGAAEDGRRAFEGIEARERQHALAILLQQATAAEVPEEAVVGVAHEHEGTVVDEVAGEITRLADLEDAVPRSGDVAAVNGVQQQLPVLDERTARVLEPAGIGQLDGRGADQVQRTGAGDGGLAKIAFGLLDAEIEVEHAVELDQATFDGQFAVLVLDHGERAARGDLDQRVLRLRAFGAPSAAVDREAFDVDGRYDLADRTRGRIVVQGVPQPSDPATQAL